MSFINVPSKCPTCDAPSATQQHPPPLQHHFPHFTSRISTLPFPSLPSPQKSKVVISQNRIPKYNFPSQPRNASPDVLILFNYRSSLARAKPRSWKASALKKPRPSKGTRLVRPSNTSLDFRWIYLIVGYDIAQAEGNNNRLIMFNTPWDSQK